MIESHFTLKHGSWLNMAEIEFSVLSCLALDQRIPTVSDLIRIVGCFKATRNAKHASVNWRFTTPDVRIKLARLYPSIPD